VVGDRLSHNRGILAHAEQHRGFALAQEVDAAEILARDHRACTVVGEREAHGVKSRELHPVAVVGAEPGVKMTVPNPERFSSSGGSA